MNDKRDSAEMPASVFRTPTALTVALLALAGCGGGGGGGDGGGESVALQECREFAELTGAEFDFLLETGVCEQFDDGVNDLPQLTAGTTTGGSVPEVTDTFTGPDTTDDPTASDDDPGSVDVGGTPEPVAEGGFSLAELDPAEEFEFGTALLDADGSSLYAGANNSARLQGPLVGAGSVANGDILRSLPYRVATTESGLELRGVAVVQETDTRSTIIGLVFNTSDELHCFARVEGIIALDTNGAAINALLESSFVDGTAGRSSVQTDTCIEAGTGVYFDLGLQASAASVAGVSADLLRSRTGTFERTETEVIPLAYTVEDDDLLVTVVNRGLVNVETGFVDVYMLDERGVAIGSTLSSTDEEIAPGAEAVLRLRTGSFPGQVSTVRVVVDFDIL